MNVRFSSLLAFVGIFLFTSCNKEFSDVDASLLPTDTFVIEKQTALVGVQHERIEVIRTDDLSFLYLGQYQDPVFGTTTSSVTTQLSLPLSSSGIFGLMSAENEEEGTSTDDTNINPHNEEETDEESVAYAVKGGVDLNCGNLYKKIPKAVRLGLLNESDVDKSLKRLLVTRLKLGMFEPKGSGPYDHLGAKHINTKKNRELAFEAASKSTVLLKNDNNVLPLSKQLNRIFVTGPNAANIDMAIGNYNGLSSEIITPLEGIVSKVDYGVSVRYSLGVELNSPKLKTSFSMMHLASSRLVCP